MSTRYVKIKNKKYMVEKTSIGFGKTSHVYVAHDPDTYVKYAVKEMKNIEDAKREAKIWKNFCFILLSDFVGMIFLKEGKAYLLSELGKQNLKDYLENKQLDLSDVKRLFRQILCGLKYLHKNGITHGDLATINIFIFEQQNPIYAKIGDFGNANKLSFSKDIGNAARLLELFLKKVESYVLPQIYYEMIHCEADRSTVAKILDDKWFDA